MASDIGDDLVEVLDELGALIEVYKYSTDETTEESVDINYEVNHVYPWTSHYIMKCDFPYSTVAEPGDLITFIDDPDNTSTYLIVALVKERFEQSVISKEGIIYMCNAVIQVQRRVETRDSNYDVNVNWVVQHSGELGFVTGLLDANKVTQKEFGEFSIDSNSLYISSSIDIQEDDRCIVNLIGQTEMSGEVYISGEPYQITAVEKNHLPKIHICKLVEDNRE